MSYYELDNNYDFRIILIHFPFPLRVIQKARHDHDPTLFFSIQFHFYFSGKYLFENIPDNQSYNI